MTVRHVHEISQEDLSGCLLACCSEAILLDSCCHSNGDHRGLIALFSGSEFSSPVVRAQRSTAHTNGLRGLRGRREIISERCIFTHFAYKPACTCRKVGYRGRIARVGFSSLRLNHDPLRMMKAPRDGRSPISDMQAQNSALVHSGFPSSTSYPHCELQLSKFLHSPSGLCARNSIGYRTFGSTLQRS